MATARKNYGRLGIHDPPEPDPSVLPADARARWEEVYADSFEAYGRKDVARATAWRTVRMSWRPGGKGPWMRCTNDRCQVWPRPRRVPRPKSTLAGHGVLIEYGYVDADGQLQVRGVDQERPPVLYWDKVGKRFYVFPYASYGSCDPIDESTPQMKAGVQAYRTFHKGRKPQCSAKIQAPDVDIFAVGVSDTVSYRSDKFDGRSELQIVELRGVPMQDPRAPSATPYIHKHWRDVWTWMDDENDPYVIVIEGGALDVHSKGIIH